MDPLQKKTTYHEYGQDWISEKDFISLQQLGENDIKLRYLEKSLKSKRRLEQQKQQGLANSTADEDVNQKYKYDKNAVVAKKFPFKAEQFKYPNQNVEKPKSLYVKYSDEYGKQPPNELELPGIHN